MKRVTVVNAADGSEQTVSWYDGTTGAEIRAAIASCCGIRHGTPFNLVSTDGSETVVAVSPSLPDQSKFTLALYPAPALRVRRRVGTSSCSMASEAGSAPTEKMEGIVELFSAEEEPETRLGLEGEADVPLMPVGSMTSELPHNGESEWAHILKFERISSHLSNERTWLAWVRTTVSVLSLALAYLKLQDWDGDKSLSVYTIGSIICGAGLMTFGLGADRYYKVKHALETRQPETSFHRLGIWSLVLLFVFIFVGTAVSYWVIANPRTRGKV